MLKLIIKGGRSFENTLNEHVFSINCYFFYTYINFNICFGCLREPSQCEGSFVYSQHLLCIRKKKETCTFIFAIFFLLAFVHL